MQIVARRAGKNGSYTKPITITVTTASELILEWVGEARPEGPRAGMGFLGMGQPAPPHQLGGLCERCKLPQRGPGRSPGRRRVFLYSEPSDIAFPSISVHVAYSLY